MAFKNGQILKMLRGRKIRLAADGTFSVRPRKTKSAKQYFDDSQQVFSIHVIIEKKFFTIATFILQHSTTDVMTKVFGLVNEWLQYDVDMPTEVESYMSDYECSSRSAVNLVWPHCKILGCAVHFQRAVFKFGRRENVYSEKTQPFAKNLLAQVYGLCYVPQFLMGVAYKVLEDQAVGETAEFGGILMEYLNTVWLEKNISVAEEEVRVNNGSEIFHWSIQRMHNWLKNNILDFTKFVRKIHLKSSIEFCQWSTGKSSLKQKKLEEAHTALQQTLQNDIPVLGEYNAVSKFIKNSRNMTKLATNFFDSVKSTLTDEEIDFTDLFIGDSNVSKTAPMNITQKPVKVQFHCSGESIPLKFLKRFISFSSAPIKIGLADNDHLPATDNLFFWDKSLTSEHAELKSVDGKIYIRDLGSSIGSFINSQRIQTVHKMSHPIQINDGDTLQFGKITITVHLATGTTIENVKKDRSTAIIKFSCADVDIPERVVHLSNVSQVVMGRSRPNKRPSVNNAYFNSNYVAHAKIWYTQSSLYLLPMGPVYIGNVSISTLTELTVPSAITFGFYNSNKSFAIHIHSIQPLVDSETLKR